MTLFNAGFPSWELSNSLDLVLDASIILEGSLEDNRDIAVEMWGDALLQLRISGRKGK
jgi:hypothetical protein